MERFLKGKPAACAPARGVVRSGGVRADEQAMIGMASLALSLTPGHPGMRQALVRLRAALDRRLAPEDAGYTVIAELTAILDRDLLAQRAQGAEMAAVAGLVAPVTRQDPVVSLYRLGKIDKDQLRAAMEIRQVAEVVGGVAMIRVVDPAAVRVDTSPRAGAMDLETYRAGHHAGGRVGDFMARLSADSRRFQRRGGREGEVMTVADIFRAIVVERRARSEIERICVCRHGVIMRLVCDALAAYVNDVRGIWAVIDAGARKAVDSGDNS
ncbi:hypothetical protein [Niveispirillum fermenti]|uniref:hypothetical protein n=1 Tax=Niveispirillum fermenti TaxID=1233113 RepID=UPI003A8A2569